MYIESKINKLQRRFVFLEKQLKETSKRTVLLRERFSNLRYAHNNYVEKLKQKHKKQAHRLRSVLKFSKLSNADLSLLKRLACRTKHLFHHGNQMRGTKENMTLVYLNGDQKRKLKYFLKQNFKTIPKPKKDVERVYLTRFYLNKLHDMLGVRGGDNI